MHPILFKFGFFEVRIYSLVYLIGILLTIFFVKKRSIKIGIDKDKIENIIIIAFLSAIVGSRVYYVILNLNYFIKNPTETIAIWHGGLTIHGGIIGGLIAVLLCAKKMKISPLVIGDLTLPFLLLSQGIGRFGNFANGELHGFPTITPFSIIFSLKKSEFTEFWSSLLSKYHVTNEPHSITNFYNNLISKGEIFFKYKGHNYLIKEYVPWGVSFPEKYMCPAYREFGNIPLHPTFFYETILDFICSVILLYFWKQNKHIGKGLIIGLYFIMYAIIRSFVSLFRAEDLMIGSIRAPHFASLILFIIGMLFIIRYYLNLKSTSVD